MEDDNTFDLYGDLEEFELKQVVKEKNDAHKKLEEKYELAIQTIKNLHNDVKVWKKKCHNIEKSFWSLLETSKAEIKRKDSQLDALRRQRDDIAFRRVKHNNIETHKSSGDGNVALPHFNPFKCPNKAFTNEVYNIDHPNSTEIEQTDYLISKDLKKNAPDNPKRKDNLHYTSENNQTVIDDKYNNKNKEYIISEKSNCRDSHRSRDKRNIKDENYSKRKHRSFEKKGNDHNADKRKQSNESLERNYYKDSEKSLERKYSKDDNRCKNSKDVKKSKPCEKDINKIEKDNQIDNKDRKNVSDTIDCKRRNSSDTTRVCTLSEKLTGNNSKESIKLTITIPNCNMNEKKQIKSKSPTPSIVLTTNTDAKKEIVKKIPEPQINLPSKNCEEYVAAKNLISELMKDLKQLNNNTITPEKITNTKSFEDVLFDNMVCGDEALSVVDDNFKPIDIEINNSNNVSCEKIENKKEICKNVQKSSEESIPLIPDEILENSISSEIHFTLENTPLIIAEDVTKVVDTNINTNDGKRDLEKSLNELIPTNNQLYNKDNEKIVRVSKNILPLSPEPAKLFGTDLTTPIKNASQNRSTIITDSIPDNNLITKNPLNTAAKFYELYLESPIKEIRNINEKTTKEVTEDIQILHTEDNQSVNKNKIEENLKKNQSTEKLINNRGEIDKKNNTKVILENKVGIFKESLNLTKTLNNENESEITPEFTEEIDKRQQFKNSPEFKELSNNLLDTNDTAKKLENNAEVGNVIENSKMISDEENDKIETLDFNQNSESIITPISMSPNQQETIEATKYLTEMLQTNTQSQSSGSNNPLKMRMKLLFGDTPERDNRMISTPNSPTKNCIISENKEENVSTNNDIVNEQVEDINTKFKLDSIKNLENNVVHELPTSVHDENEIALTTTIRKNEKSTKERRNKRKAEISPKRDSSKVPNEKKFKIDSSTESKLLGTEWLENEKNEIQPEISKVLNSNKYNIDSSSMEKESILLTTVQSENELITTPTKNDNYEIDTKLNDKKSPLRNNKRPHSNSNTSTNSNLQQFNSVQSKSKVVSKKFKVLHVVENEKMPLNENINNNFVKENCFHKYDENIDKNSQLVPCTNMEVRFSDTELSDDISDPVILTLNISRKKRVNKNTKCSKNINISPEHHTNLKPEVTLTTIEKSVTNISNLNMNCDQKTEKLPQIYLKTIEERRECINSYKIPKLNKSSNKNNSIVSEQKNFMKHFKIPKINKNAEIVQNKLEEDNVIKDSISQYAKENSQNLNINIKEQIKLRSNDDCNNLPDLACKSTSEKVNTNPKSNKFENTSTPKQQNNLPMPIALSKNDEDLFDCTFKSPLQISGGNISPQLLFGKENSDGSSKYNQVEEDFRKLFGKSPRSTSDVLSASIPVCTENENNSIQNYNQTQNENLANSQADLSVINNESRNNITANNSTSSINESSILCKNFSTSSKEYQMVYDTNEGITNWVITRKKIKKKKKSIT